MIKLDQIKTKRTGELAQSATGLMGLGVWVSTKQLTPYLSLRVLIRTTTIPSLARAKSILNDKGALLWRPEERNEIVKATNW